MIIENKTPFQFGDPRNGDYMVFDCIDRGLAYKPSITTERAKSTLFNGEARLNGSEPNKLGDTSIKIKFSTESGSKYTQDYILQLFAKGPQKLFAYSSGDIESPKPFKVFWQYAEIVDTVIITSGVSRDAEDVFTYDITVLLENPEWYEADNTLSLFAENQPYPLLDGSLTFNGSITLGEYETTTFPAFSTLNAEEQRNYLGDSLPLSVLDKYYTIESWSLSTESYLTNTLTTNNVLTLNTLGLDLKTSLPSYLYQLQFNSLNQDETIKITNITTNSDVLITWLDIVPNVTDLLFISKDNILYNPFNQQQIDSTRYRVDSVTGTLLYFSSHLQYSINTYIPNSYEYDTLLIQKQTSGNNQIQLSTLKSYL